MTAQQQAKAEQRSPGNARHKTAQLEIRHKMNERKNAERNTEWPTTKQRGENCENAERTRSNLEPARRQKGLHDRPAGR